MHMLSPPPSFVNDRIYVFLYVLGWLVGWFGFNGPLRQYFSLAADRSSPSLSIAARVSFKIIRMAEKT